MTDEKPKKRRGRPPKDEATANLARAIAQRKAENTKMLQKDGKRKTDTAIINTYMNMVLEAPESPQILAKIMAAAMDDEHKHQAIAWKIVTDRIMPLSYFEKDKNGNGKAAVQITISGVGGTTTIGAPNPEEDVIDGDFTET